jgi:hypothetical protein
MDKVPFGTGFLPRSSVSALNIGLPTLHIHFNFNNILRPTLGEVWKTSNKAEFFQLSRCFGQNSIFGTVGQNSIFGIVGQNSIFGIVGQNSIFGIV